MYYWYGKLAIFQGREKKGGAQEQVPDWGERLGGEDGTETVAGI